MVESPTSSQNAVVIKGSLFALTVLQLQTSDILLLTEQLTHMAKQFPHFFQHTPVIIDVQKVNSQKKPAASVDFESLNAILRQKHMIPVAIRHANPEQQALAISAGLAIMPEQKTKIDTDITEITPVENKTTAQAVLATSTGTSTRLITQPVRSGQQVYAQHTDLLVLAPVSHGAELLADGHIHVYGALRGRALAGIQGNRNARIFCESLDAELISIAGVYQVKEHLRVPEGSGMIHIYLQDDELKIVRM